MKATYLWRPDRLPSGGRCFILSGPGVSGTSTPKCYKLVDHWRAYGMMNAVCENGDPGGIMVHGFGKSAAKAIEAWQDEFYRLQPRLVCADVEASFMTATEKTLPRVTYDDLATAPDMIGAAGYAYETERLPLEERAKRLAMFLAFDCVMQQHGAERCDKGLFGRPSYRMFTRHGEWSGSLDPKSDSTWLFSRFDDKDRAVPVRGQLNAKWNHWLQGFQADLANIWNLAIMLEYTGVTSLEGEALERERLAWKRRDRLSKWMRRRTDAAMDENYRIPEALIPSLSALSEKVKARGEAIRCANIAAQQLDIASAA